MTKCIEVENKTTRHENVKAKISLEKFAGIQNRIS